MAAKVVLPLLLMVAVGGARVKGEGNGKGEGPVRKRPAGAIAYGEGLARAAVGRFVTRLFPEP
jgi:hypothetical protein